MNEKNEYIVPDEFRLADLCCSHTNTVREGSFLNCSDCGLEIQNIFNYEQTWKSCLNDIIKNGGYSIRKQDDKSIFKDVEGFGFEEKIIEVANELYCMVTELKNYRGSYRKAIIFATLFYAIKMDKSNTLTINEGSIKNIFGLDKKTIIKGIKLINLSLPKYIPVKTNYVTEHDLLVEYIDKWGPDNKEMVEREVMILLQSIKNRSSLINRSRPQSVICSLLYYYLTKTLYVTIPIEEYAKKIDLSSMTIQKLSKEFDRLKIEHVL